MTHAQTDYDGPERRALDRTPLSLAITIREAGKHQLPAILTSLNHKGCGATGVSLSSKHETMVWVRLPGIESQPARLCWSKFGAAGFAFAQPLHPAVAERLSGNSTISPGWSPVANVTFEDDRTLSRREQILKGRAQIHATLLERKRDPGRPATLDALIRRRTSRVVDQRHEPRFPPPAAAELGFRLSGQPASVSDISPSGVRVNATIADAIGSPVEIAFAGFPPLEGAIVWVRDGATGVRLPENSLDLFESA